MLALAYIYRTSCDALFIQTRTQLRKEIHVRELILQQQRDAQEQSYQ